MIDFDPGATRRIQELEQRLAEAEDYKNSIIESYDATVRDLRQRLAEAEEALRRALDEARAWSPSTEMMRRIDSILSAALTPTEEPEGESDPAALVKTVQEGIASIGIDADGVAQRVAAHDALDTLTQAVKAAKEALRKTMVFVDQSDLPLFVQDAVRAVLGSTEKERGSNRWYCTPHRGVAVLFITKRGEYPTSRSAVRLFADADKAKAAAWDAKHAGSDVWLFEDVEVPSE